MSTRDGLDFIELDYRATSRETEPGAPFDLKVSITNTWILPATFLKTKLLFPKAFILPEKIKSEEEQFTKSIEFTSWIKPGETIKASFPISCEKRGLHHLSGAVLERGDFLGLTETTRKYYSRSSVLVYPKPYDNLNIQDTLGKLYGEMTSRRFLIKDPVLTLNCREYTGQEPMHTISWTQTARLGELMVREFEPTRQLACGIIIYNEGLKAEEEPLLDLCCSIARTAGEYLIHRGVLINFFTNSSMSGFTGKTIRQIKSGKENVKDYLAMLASLLIHKSGSKESLLESILSSSEEKDAILLIAPKHSPGLDSLLTSLGSLSGIRPELIIAEEIGEIGEPEKAKEDEYAS